MAPKKKKITAYLDAATANKLYAMAYTSNGTSKYGSVSNTVSNAINTFYTATVVSETIHSSTDSAAHTVRTDLVIPEEDEDELQI
jgi:hypothetical protein